MWLAFLLLLLGGGLLVLPVSAQRRKVSPGPRALAVIVWGYSPGAIQDLPTPSAVQRPPTPWLVPVTVWEEQRFWDAEIYKASPRPMALEPEVIYEAARNGASVGLFTVSGPTRIRRVWFADGRWRTNEEIEASAKRHAEAAKPPAEITSSDAPPRLRRGGTPSAPPSAPPSPAPEKKTETTPPAVPPSTPVPSPVDDEAPVLRRGKPSAKPEAPAIPDRARPAAPAAPSGRPAGTSAKTPPAGTVLPGETLVAISDAKAIEPRVYTFSWSDEEQQRSLRGMQQLAATAIARYAAERYVIQSPRFDGDRAAGANAPGFTQRPARPRRPAKSAPPPQAPEPQLADVQFKAFDLDGDNYPELVLTAAQPQRVTPRDGGAPVDRTFYVTLVARADLNPGSREPLRVLLSYVSDDARLEIAPRLVFLDVTDADGDGVGELLFRTAGPARDDQDLSTWTFQLFRAGPDKLQKLFDSAAPVQ